MPKLESVADEKALSKKLWDDTNFSELRTQMETDYNLWGPYAFKMPKEEGKWTDVSTNSPKVLMNKIIGLLSSSWVHLSIPEATTNTDEPSREKISATERVGMGCIAQANRNLTKVPSGKTIQGAHSYFAPLRGGVASMVYLYMKDGRLVSDIRTFDPLRVQWLEGADGLSWFCHRYYESISYLKSRYDDLKDDMFSGKEQKSGRALCLNVIRPDEYGLIVGAHDKFIGKAKNNLGYIPVKLNTCGSVPIIQSTNDDTNTLKYSFVSAFANNRDIYDLESKLLSIETSKAIESGKIKITGQWDSARSGGELPKGIERLGYSEGNRNEVILFDAAKGQEFGAMVQPPSNEIVDRLLQVVRGMDILGSVDPIAFGQLNRSGASGTLAAELRSAALEFISPFQVAIEENIAWIAEESTSQFKNQDFDKQTFNGSDRYGDKYSIDVDPNDIDDKLYFTCDVVIDRLRDRAQEVGTAIQEVQYGFSSRKTAMSKHKLQDNPDAEMDMMEEELAEQDPVTRYDKLAMMYADMGTPEGDRMALYYQSLSQIQIEQTIQAALQLSQQPESQAQGPGNTPQAQTAKIGAETRGV